VEIEEAGGMLSIPFTRSKISKANNTKRLRLFGIPQNGRLLNGLLKQPPKFACFR